MARIITAGIDISLACAKPGCIKTPVQRHHMGSERMWLRHFGRRRRSKRWQDFYTRYNDFRVEDICPLCLDHHEEIHVHYLNIMFAAIKRRGYTPLREWSWEEAEGLMDEMRTFCRGWLREATPGIAEHRQVG